MIDAPAVILGYYAAQPALTALTGNRLWAEHDMPPPKYTPSVGGAIVFKIRGGRPDYMGSTLNPSVQFKIYGADEYIARNVYRIWYDVTVNGYGHGIKSSEVEVLGQMLSEPDTGWVYYFTSARFWLRAN